MGYRNYLCFADKKLVNKIRKMNKDELWDFVGRDKAYSEECLKRPPFYYDLKDLIKLEEVFDFGKNFDVDVSKYRTPLFKNKEVNEFFNDDTEFVLVKNEIFEYFLDYFRNRVISYYTKLVAGEPLYEFDDRPQEKRLLSDAKGHLLWSKFLGRPEGKFSLGGGWIYEHEIFNLTYVMKIFNPKKQVLIWCGM